MTALVALLAALGLFGSGSAEPPKVTYTYSVRTMGAVASDPDTVAAFARRAYTDPRGWSLRGQIAFRRVPTGGDYTLWLVPAAAMSSFSPTCTSNFSCRAGRNVVLNDTRWRTGSVDPGWTLPLEQYRSMVINHETGHWLGLHHTYCRTPGAPATLMQQQSKSLQGCTPNVWPLESELALVAGPRGLAVPRA